MFRTQRTLPIDKKWDEPLGYDTRGEGREMGLDYQEYNQTAYSFSNRARISDRETRILPYPTFGKFSRAMFRDMYRKLNRKSYVPQISSGEQETPKW